MSDSVTDPISIAMLRGIVAAHGRALVTQFYDVLLQDDEAKQFLTHSAVHDRLSASLLDWLDALLDERDIRDCPELQERQRAVGKVHARIKIPIHLVMEGAMAIKAGLAQRLIELEQAPDAAMRAFRLANERLDAAIMMMSQAYVSDTAARARLDEAYRLFSLDQDVAIEKEAQKASLMEWSQKALFNLLRGRGGAGLERLSPSPFGLWIRHRAEFMFGTSPSFKQLLDEMGKIDGVLLPQLEATVAPDLRGDILTQLQASLDLIAYLLNDLFQALNVMENGRDPLTRALNRRFLPAILGREVTFAREKGTPLSLILLDVDHFKAINDRHGHQTGDVVLRDVARVLMEYVRPSDFVFRYGGEEFLVVLAETDIAAARAIGERIRTALAGTPLDTGDGGSVTVTASIGIANYTGHPDQSRLISAADEALYAAKRNGRNRIEIAGLAMAEAEG